MNGTRRAGPAVAVAVLAGVVALALGPGQEEATSPAAPASRGGTGLVGDGTPGHRSEGHRVLEVVDGDTLRVRYHGDPVSVRIIGIDTPETVAPDEPEECGGRRAVRAARRMLDGTRVTLVLDPSQGRRDVYGRLLAYVQAPGAGDVGLALIRQGHAVEYTHDTGYRRRHRYRRAERWARSHGRGLWSACGGADTVRGSSR